MEETQTYIVLLGLLISLVACLAYFAFKKYRELQGLNNELKMSVMKKEEEKEALVKYIRALASKLKTPDLEFNNEEDCEVCEDCKAESVVIEVEPQTLETIQEVSKESSPVPETVTEPEPEPVTEPVQEPEKITEETLEELCEQVHEELKEEKKTKKTKGKRGRKPKKKATEEAEPQTANIEEVLNL